MRSVWSATDSTPACRRPLLVTALVLAGLVFGTHAIADRSDRKARRAERRLAMDAIRRGEYDLPTRYWREGPVRYLLSQDEDKAFRAMTIYPAELLRVDDRIGSIDEGKDADLVILSGDPLERDSRVEKVIFNGKVVYELE